MRGAGSITASIRVKPGHTVQREACDAGAGEQAVTHWRALADDGRFTLLACSLETGRTHQIRVHLASIGHPCLGDAEYGFKRNRYSLAGQALHSYQLTIDHPATGERMTFTAPPPEYFQELIKKLQKS